MTWPSSVRVLGVCGLLAACLMSLSGFLDAPAFAGVSGAVMVVANAYAMVKS